MNAIQEYDDLDDIPVPTMRYVAQAPAVAAKPAALAPIAAPVISPPPDCSGCALCSGGILSAPPLTLKFPLYAERYNQYLAGDIQFCTCNTGQLYRRYMLGANRKASEADIRLPKPV